jgi:arginyl-tRNA synthetase
MNKPTSVTVTLDQDTAGIFQQASEIVSNAGIRVPTAQLVQTLINAEMSRLSSRKIAQRFLKSVMQQVGGLARNSSEDEDEDTLPEIPKLPTK